MWLPWSIFVMITAIHLLFLALSWRDVKRNAETRKVVSNAEIIEKAIGSILGVSPEMLRMRTRKRQIVEARQMAMYFYRAKTPHSLSKIGRLLGNYDHATVVHACKTVGNLVETNAEFREKFQRVKSEIN